MTFPDPWTRRDRRDRRDLPDLPDLPDSDDRSDSDDTAERDDLEARARRGLADDVRRTLLARRVVLVHGPLHEALVAETAATLMMLDATGDERIVLRFTGADATIEQGLVLMDVIAVLGVPVDVVAAGTLAGGAVGVLAVGRHRTLAAHATLHLREPDGEVSGRAVEIERALAAESARRDQFFARIAGCTGRPQQMVEECWRAAGYLEPFDAVALGYADDVA